MYKKQCFIFSPTILLTKMDTSTDEDLKSRISARRIYVLTEGRKREGIADGTGTSTVPVWYDPVAFKRAQQLFNEYSAIIHVSQFFGLLLVYNHFEATMPLLVTEVSRTISKLYTRYLSTMVHVRNWFTYDPFDPESKAFKSLNAISGFHHQVATKMNHESSPHHYGPDDLWISQYAMCYAQFTFMGLMTVFPKEFGYGHFMSKDFHAMFHFWRVIGHCLGIDDRFNLCAGTDEETMEFCRQIYYKDWIPMIEAKTEKGGLAMTKGIAIAMAQVVPIINYNAMLHYSAPFMQLNIEDYPLESIKDHADYAAFVTLFKVGNASKLANLISSRLTQVAIKGSSSLRSIHEKRLKRKYDDKISFEPDERCPLNITIEGYKNAFELELD